MFARFIACSGSAWQSTPSDVSPWRKGICTYAGLPVSAFSRNRGGDLNPAFQNLVDQAIAHGIGCRHEIVTVRVLLDGIHALARVLGQDLVEPVTGVEHFPGMDFHVRG